MSKLDQIRALGRPEIRPKEHPLVEREPASVTRTKASGAGVAVMVRLQPDLLAKLDMHIHTSHKIGQRPKTRPEAVRNLLKEALRGG